MGGGEAGTLAPSGAFPPVVARDGSMRRGTMTPDERSDDVAGPDMGPKPARAAPSIKDRIIEALLELSAEREWDDFGLTDVATRAGVSLSEFRDAFPSKGAVLAGFARKIDHVVLQQENQTLADEAPRERVFDVLMRRLDAMAPYKLGLQGIMEHVRRDPLMAAALNGVVLNSMRFMLASAGVDVGGKMAGLKLQGLAVSWGRVLDAWFDDEDPGQAKTMAALDRELSKGETWVARLDDLDRLVSPLRILGRAMMDTRRRTRERRRSAAPRAGGLDGLDGETAL